MSELSTPTEAKHGTLGLPYLYTPRGYQSGVWKAWNRGIRRFCLVWHRRAGKDKTLLNFMITRMAERIGTYYYVFPRLNQGRRILWDGIGKDGFRYMDHFLPDAVYARHEQEMKLTMKRAVKVGTETHLLNEPGSVFQIVGTDNPDVLVGTNPIGVVMSEYAIQDPQGWKLLSPILLENKGWAAFAFTPRGRNHGFRLYSRAKNNPNWYCELLTVDDTRVDGQPVITHGEIAEEISLGLIDEELAQQEYWCSFEGAMQGSYFGKLLSLMRAENRVTRVPHDSALPVVTAWDLGMDDATAIWSLQIVGREVRAIDYYENRGFGLGHYVKYLREKPWAYSQHFLPHDVKVRELGTGTSRIKTLRDLGMTHIKVVPAANPEDRVEATRRLLPMMYADAQKCERGLDALSAYHREYDEKKAEFKNNPLHDWSSHACDALGHFAMMFRGFLDPKRQTKTDSYFNPHDYEKPGQTQYDSGWSPYDV